MPDYEPLDLSEFYNAGVDTLGQDQEPAVGRQTFRGLPFLIGGEADEAGSKCYIALDGPARPVTVPVGRPANRVIFAHSLLESSMPEGAAPGTVVAEYVFNLAGGRQERTPVRERFEIAARPVGDGSPLSTKPGPGRGRLTRAALGYPYLAVPDENDTLLARHEGQWDLVGRRQTEASLGTIRDYCLLGLGESGPGRGN